MFDTNQQHDADCDRCGELSSAETQIRLQADRIDQLVDQLVDQRATVAADDKLRRLRVGIWDVKTVEAAERACVESRETAKRIDKEVGR